MIIRSCSLFILFVLSALTPRISVANVFEQDDRVSFSPTKKPWTAVGKLTTSTEAGVGICTGTLVGPSHVITAAHCVIVDKEKGTVASGLRVAFQPAYQAGASQDKSWAIEIKVGTRFPTKEFHKDWAIIRLARPLGETYGYLIPFTLNPKSVPLRAALVGYSADYMQALNGSFQNSCEIKSIRAVGDAAADRLYYHDCDMHGGASGGPLVTWYQNMPFIVAINVAEKLQADGSAHADGVKYSLDSANIATPVFRAITEVLLAPN